MTVEPETPSTKKKVECPECGGSGYVDCPRCNSPEAEVCDTCDGDGEIEEDEDQSDHA